MLSKVVQTEPAVRHTSMSFRSCVRCPQMNCPSEERVIRVALDGVEGVEENRCDLANGKCTSFIPMTRNSSTSYDVFLPSARRRIPGIIPARYPTPSPRTPE